MIDEFDGIVSASLIVCHFRQIYVLVTVEWKRGFLEVRI